MSFENTSLDAIGAARASIARDLGGVDPKEILFTSCATESNNTAIFGAVRANPNRKHVITTTVEHPAALLPGNGQALLFGVSESPLVPSTYGSFAEDEKGFWEDRGYHNEGDPWKQERYA